MGGFTALALGLYGARESARVVGGAVERWLGTPRLVRETSRFSIWNPKSWRTAAPKSKDEVKRDFRWG